LDTRFSRDDATGSSWQKKFRQTQPTTFLDKENIVLEYTKTDKTKHKNMQHMYCIVLEQKQKDLIQNLSKLLKAHHVSHTNYIKTLLLLALQSLVDLSLFQNCRPVSKFRSFSTEHFLWVGVFNPKPNRPNLEDQGIPFLSGSSPLTCLPWETLPVTMPPPP
jgi:hypothetical protein